jgi:hypothetical protein
VTVASPPARPWRTPGEVLRALTGAVPADRDVVLVPHSNAGLYVPALTAVRRVAGYLFVDAGLPGDTGPVPVAPPALRDGLRPLAGPDGLLPPWTDWWPEADVAALFPDAATRRDVEREQVRLPLSYFDGTLPVPAGWAAAPGGYLAFGDTYAEDRARAADRGWPVATLAGAHLHLLVDPGAVAAAIDGLVASTVDG